jgi:hypothetical protein
MAAATIFAAACGDDGSSQGPSAAPTATRTPNGTATPIPTPTIIIEPCFAEASALTMTIRTLPGADLDVGWSGISHDLPATHDGSVAVNLDCPVGFCTIDGSDLVGRGFGTPLPLSAGGIAVCVVSSFREAVTGTYDACNGCTDAAVKLTSRIFSAEDADTPCPPCLDDPTPNCLPDGTSIGDLAIDLSPLATGPITLRPSVDCRSGAFPSGSCFCPGQAQPNACDDGVCPASGVCERGPIDSVCDGHPSRSCRSGTGTEDCDARFPGAGTCIDRPRPCFASEITRTGLCGTEESTLVSIFCIPATSDDAINTMIGLPGPGALTLPVTLLRTPR